jgi:hypothetical protein
MDRIKLIKECSRICGRLYLVTYNNREFSDDIQLIVSAIKKENFEIINIYANRLISNGYIFNNRAVTIVGFIIKDLCYLINSYNDLKSSKEESTVKVTSSLTLFVKKIEQYLKSGKPINLDEVHDDYYVSFTTLRPIFQSPEESAVYNSNSHDLFHEALVFLLNFISNHKNQILPEKFHIIERVLTEISRLISAYGISKSDLKVYMMLSCLFHITDYYRYYIILSNETKSENEYLGFVDKILETSFDLENKQNEVNAILFEMLSRWRDLFLLLGELSKVKSDQVLINRNAINQDNSRLELSHEVRQRLSDFVESSIKDSMD